MLRLEYKTCDKAESTGNAFVEVLSANYSMTGVDPNATPGWARKSRADFLVYLLWQPKIVMIASMPLIRVQLFSWALQFPMGWAMNEGYRTRGILVPLNVFATACPLVHKREALDKVLRSHGQPDIPTVPVQMELFGAAPAAWAEN